MRDPHEVLGVSRGASVNEIKEAYRQLALKYHPDKHAQNALRDLAEAKFREIKAAYDALVQSDGTPSSATRDSAPRPEGAAEEFNEILQLLHRRLWDEARSRATKWAQAHGESPGILAALGAAADGQGHVGQAADYLGRASERAPQRDDFAVGAASAHVRAGRFAAALPFVLRAQALVGEIPQLLALEALARENLPSGQEKARARALWERVRVMDPSNELLQQRSRSWQIGSTYVDKQKTTSDACCLCLLFELLFDCI